MTETAVEPAAAEIADWLGRFEQALADGDAVAASELFGDESFWRDLVAFTWNLKTLEGPAEIRAMLESQLPHVRPTAWRTTDPPSEADGITEAWIAFETAVGRGTGILRLRDGKAWTLLTALGELKGHEEPKGDNRPPGAIHGAHPDRLSWLEMREREARELGHEVQPEVVIVGGGQGGIALGARLRQLGVPTIIVERNERPGDSWRKRYKSLCLHDPVWYDHMPYLKFPEHWPVFSPKDKIGDWLEMYTRVMELNYWGSTEAKSATYDPEAGEWRSSSSTTGPSSRCGPSSSSWRRACPACPNVPEIPGMADFRGDQHHSVPAPRPDAYAGKRCVVIGSNNSAHDICAALWEAGAAEVTMVQRSSTHIVRSESLMGLGMRALYSEAAVANGMTTERADTVFASMPYRIMHERPDPAVRADRARGCRPLRASRAGRLPARLRRRRVGSVHEVPAPRLGLLHRRRRLRARCRRRDQAHGRHRRPPHRDSVVMTDGTELPADLVVYATGYGSMNGWAAQLISQDVADKVGKVWGLGSDTTMDPGPWEGEQRNMWKPTQQPGLWFHGGNLAPVAPLLPVPGAAAQGARRRASTRRSTGCRRCTTSADRRRGLARRLSPHDVPRYTMRAHMFTPPTFESLLP